jgi:hypothetical protein
MEASQSMSFLWFVMWLTLWLGIMFFHDRTTRRLQDKQRQINSLKAQLNLLQSERGKKRSYAVVTLDEAAVDLLIPYRDQMGNFVHQCSNGTNVVYVDVSGMTDNEAESYVRDMASVFLDKNEPHLTLVRDDEESD